MKTLIKNNGIIKLATAWMLTLLVGFACHAQAATPSYSAAFDHTQTGFILKDVHLTLKCEQCHVQGIFKNTPKNCAGCHANGTRVGATPQPINHVQTAAACDNCHTSTANFLVKSFNHMSVTGNCISCHNGQSLGVVSKPVGTHIPTLQPCELCHTNTTTFTSWQMGDKGHTGITSNCFACHGGPAGEPGVVATYPGVVSYNSSTHFPITQPNNITPDCNACHTNFNTFLGATYNHVGVSFSLSANSTGSCTSCHSGQMAGVVSVPPIPANHIQILPAGSDCSYCHSNTTSFLGAVYSHANVVAGTCESCHTGAYPGVMTKGATHIPTQSYKCDSCHTSVNTVGFTVFSGSTYHGSVTATAGTCSTCHNGSYVAAPELAQGATNGASTIHIPISSTQTCDLCHTQSNTNSYIAFSGALYHTSVIAPSGSCISCHDSSFNTGAWTAKGLLQGTSGQHIPTLNASCDVCHTSANTAQFTSFSGALYHTSVTSPATCSTCHASSGAGTFINSPWNALGFNAVPTHFPVGSLTCGQCHTASNTVQYTSFSGATYHGSVSASAAGVTCDTCHSVTYYSSVYNTQSTAQYPASLGTHPTQNGFTCDHCHTQSLTQNYTTFLGATFDHTTIGSQTCLSCHNGTNATGKSANHLTYTPTTEDCNTCHTSSNTQNYTTFLGAGYHANTTVQAGSCGTGSSCHNATGAASNSGALDIAANHPLSQTPTLSCDSASGCHSAAKVNFSTWTGTQYHPNGDITGGCAQSNCHSTTNPATGTMWGTALPIAASHPTIPTSVAITSCNSTGGCHSTVAPSYTNWSGTQFHPGGDVTGGCAQSNCHSTTNPATGKMWGTALPIAASHPPIPTGTSITSCNSTGGCHSTVAPSYTNWSGTNYHPNGSVTGGCAQSNCHTGSPLWGTALGINTGHVTYTAQDCGTTCHTVAKSASFSTWLGASYAHDTNAAGKCQQCHDGVQANGLSKPHLPVTAGGSCDAAGCHSGTTVYSSSNVALGYPGAWAGALYVHAVPPGTCSTCHGISASIYPNVSTQTNCYGSTAACPSPSPFAHQSTSAACDQCHTATASQTQTTWANAGFPHSTTLAAPAGAPTGSCLYSGCHGAGGTAKTIASYPNHIQVGAIITSTMSCDNGGCHKVWNGTSVTTFAGGILPHSSFPTTRCDACHGVYTAFGTYGAVGKVSNHIPTTMSLAVASSTGAGDCNVCHISGATSIAPTGAAISGSAAWVTEVVGVNQHGGFTGGGTGGVYCVTCHLSSATYLASKIQKTSHNKASTTTDCSSSKCHKPTGSKGTAYTKWN